MLFTLFLGVIKDDITILSVSDVVISAATSTFARVASGSGRTKIMFSVATVMEDLGYADWAVMVDDLQADIEVAFADPVTAEAFVQTAVDMGSLSVTGSTVVTFEELEFSSEVQVEVSTPTPTVAPTQLQGSSSGSSGMDKEYQIPLIAGIAGGFVLCVVLAVLLYCKAQRQKAEDINITGTTSTLAMNKRQNLLLDNCIFLVYNNT